MAIWSRSASEILRSLWAWFELRRLHREMLADLNDETNWMRIDWFRRTRKYNDDVEAVKRWVKTGE